MLRGGGIQLQEGGHVVPPGVRCLLLVHGRVYCWFEHSHCTGRTCRAGLPFTIRSEYQARGDQRPRTWLMMDKVEAHELAGYKE